MGVAIKAPIPADVRQRLERVATAYQRWLYNTKAGLPISEKMRRRFSQFYRSKGERRHVASYYAAEFVIDVETAATGTRQPGSLIPAMAAC
jgi:hypothetical protein